MLFGLAEMEKFAEESNDPRVKAMWKRLRGALSKNSKWCSALAKAERNVADLNSEIKNLQSKVKQLELALSDAIPWIGEPAEGPSWATDEAKAKNRRMCGDALETACDVLESIYKPQERKKQ